MAPQARLNPPDGDVLVAQWLQTLKFYRARLACPAGTRVFRAPLTLGLLSQVRSDRPDKVWSAESNYAGEKKWLTG